MREIKKEGSRDYNRWLPDAALPRYWRQLSPACRWAFLSTFFLGLATHLFLFANKLPNGDDLSDLYHFNSMASSGRWFDIVAKGLSGYYSAPWAIGMVSLFFLALSAAFLCHLLKVRRKSSALLLAATLVTYPVLAAHFSYMFYADLYMVALFCSVLSIWWARERWWGILPGGFCLALALGSYQAYLSVAVVVALLSLIVSSLEPKQNGPALLGRGLRYLASGGLGLSLYFFVQKWIMSRFHVVLTDYQNIENMGKTSWEQIKEGLAQAYGQPGFFYFGETFFSLPVFMKILCGLLAALALVFLLTAAVKSRIWQSLRLPVLLAALAALPLGFNLIYLMAPDSYMHCLMFPAYMLYLGLPVILYEAAYPSSAGPRPGPVSAWQAGLAWLLSGITAIAAFGCFLHINVSYLHLHLKYEIAYATELRILDRLEQLPEYTAETPVVFGGAFPNDSISLQPFYTKEVVGDMVGLRGNLVYHRLNYKGFYLNYFGRELNVVEDEIASQIRATEEYAAMPQWPAAGSVAMIQGYAVVKIV